MANSTLRSQPVSSPLGDSPIPLYLRVADILRDRIYRGVWPTGTRIPTLEALAEEFGVARVTVRQAVQLLTKESLLDPRRGRGTVVTNHERSPKVVVMQTSLRSLGAMYDSTSPTILTFDESQGTPPVSPWAGKLGTGYVFMHRLHFTEGQPYALIRLHLLSKIFQRAPDAFRTRAVIPQLLKMKSVHIHRAHQTMSIGSADAETARLLRVLPGTPVAHVARVFLDADDLILYLADVIYRGDWVKWEIDLQP